ncbi:MAG: hypothetical protein H0U83_07550 [Sphingomonas sp.]|nr:hypothetical protein [Sphingomonas sp.]
MDGLDERTAPVLSEVDGPALTTSQPATRHDGWSGEKMATFCEVLADTAVVAEACDQAGMGMSGAYALRRRDAFFAAAWDVALAIARERLADTLLARSIEGNIEQIWRDGELVGERHVIDNRLGLAILRRLDRLSAGEMPGASRTATSKPAPRCISFDWDLMVDALRTADPDAIAASLAMLKGHEVEEVEGPPGHSLGASGGGSSPNLHIEEDEDDGIDLSDRCWKDGIDDIWVTISRLRKVSPATKAAPTAAARSDMYAPAPTRRARSSMPTRSPRA